MRRQFKTAVALGVSATVLACSSAADAASVRVDDPAGDGLKGRDLDITSVRVSNRDHAIITTIAFVKVVGGDLAIYYQARGDGRRDLAGVLSKHRRSGDTNIVETIDGVQRCKALSVVWDDAADTVQVRLPSRCFRDGDYGAVHAKAITEIGDDADIAPKDSDGHWRWTPWVSRG